MPAHFRSPRHAGPLRLAAGGSAQVVGLIFALAAPASACLAPVGTGELRVTCLGDSNTDPRWRGYPSWCERISDSIEAENCGIVFTQANGGLTPDGATQLAASTGKTVVIAFGTNELADDKSSAETAVSIVALFNAAEEDGRSAYVGTVPYRFSQSGDLVRETETRQTNVALGLLLPPDRLIDFTNGFEADFYTDGIHFTEQGHELRAARVREVIGLPEPDSWIQAATAAAAMALLTRRRALRARLSAAAA